MAKPIGVYTKAETLQEKKDYAKDPQFYVYWRLSKRPKEKPSRIYFASDKKWQGYFTIEKANLDSTGHFMIYLDTWQELEEKPERTPFRGFTYNVPEGYR